MTRIVPSRTLLTGAALAVAGVLIAGCSPNDSSSSAAAPASSAAAPASAAAAPAASSAAPVPSQPTSFKRVPLNQPTGEFASPSRNITCEVDTSSVLCETNTPYQSVTLTTSGTYKTCEGVNCLSNAAEGTPTLAYGTETGNSSFLCQSSTAGITCTANGRGFLISKTGVTPVPA